MPNDLGQESWHLDKRVPISLIAAVALQTLTFVWLLATMNTKIDATIARTAQLESVVAERYQIIHQNSTGIAVANESLKNVQQSLVRIEKKLDDTK